MLRVGVGLISKRWHSGNKVWTHVESVYSPYFTKSIRTIYFYLVRFHISQSNLQLVIWGFFVQSERDLAALIWSPIKVRFALSELSRSLSFSHFWNTLGEHNKVYVVQSYYLLNTDSSCSWGTVGVLCWVWLPIACVMCLRAAELSEPGLVMQSSH